MSSKVYRVLMFFLTIVLLLLFVSLITAKAALLPAKAETVGAGSGSWSWQHPQPQGNELQGVDCPTADDCYAGGYLGFYDDSSNNRAFVIQSKDGNETWKVQELVGHGINGLHCLSANTCFAASFFGHVLKTTNGGQSWSTFITNTSKNLQSIHCFNGNNCMVVGDGGTIQETTNGGQTWVTRTSNTSLNLQDIICLDASVCLVVGGSGMEGTGNGIVLRSQNGGDSWQQITTQVGNVLNAVDCFDTKTCVAVGWGGMIYVSENEGSSWRSASAHTSGNLTDIECPATDKCFFTSYDGQIFTSNNGYIWLEIDTQNDIALNSISCPTAQQCTAVGQNGHILTTINGGRDWYRKTEGTITSDWETVCYDGGNLCQLEYMNRINQLECLANGRCLAVSHEGLLFIGDPLTHSWIPQKINTTQNLQGLSCFEGVSANSCYVVGSSGTVWKSVNNGNSWQTTTTGVTSRLFDIDCPAANTCVAVGEDGAAIRTSNGGTSWQTVSTTTTRDLFAVTCPSTNKCVAVGDVGETVYSNNGGQTWQKPVQPPAVSTYAKLKGIDCQSTTNCLVVGGDFPPNTAVLFSTTDGGKNWISGSINSTFWMSDIDCTLAGSCTAVGQMGSIFHSEDNGVTWQEQSSGTSWPLLSVSCLADGSCFTGGEQGIILGAPAWPELSVKQSFFGTSFSDNATIIGEIKIVNEGSVSAQQVQITHSLPSTLQPGGPVSVSWGSETATINNPTWPNILAGLNITLTTGSTLRLEFPLVVNNPQQLVQQTASIVEAQANGLPKPVQDYAFITLAQYTLFTPFISSPAPGACYGPKQDNFASSNSGWPSGDTGSVIYGYASGEYSILHEEANQWFAVTRRDLWQDDLLLELEGYQLANSGLWGLLFGLNNDWSDFYTFEIVPNNQEWYVFHFNSATGWSLIFSGSTNISAGQGKNDLLIQGANGKMYFYVNNYLVYEMNQKQGYVGLTGGSFSNNTYLRYDNYLFHQNECAAFHYQGIEGGGDYPAVIIDENRLLTLDDRFGMFADREQPKATVFWRR